MIKISGRELNGEVEAISSKSFAHRIIFCSAVSDKPTKVYLNEFSEDINASFNCIENLGAKVYRKNNSYVEIEPIKDFLVSNNPITFNVNESGTTYRFIIPFASSLYNHNIFLAKKGLLKRPIDDLLNILINNGCYVKKEDKLEIYGKFSFDDVNIAGNVSSQYISALLLSSVLQKNKVSINLINYLESKSYVDITIDVMKKFGVKVLLKEKKYIIEKSSRYISPEKIFVEGDWSNSSFFLVAGALSKNGVKVSNINMNSIQGDREILNILRLYGADIVEKDSLFVRKKLQKKFTVDIKNIPDLAPILAVLASSAVGESKLVNIERLRLKESDRVKSTIDLVNNLGGEAFEANNQIIIRGKGFLDGGNVDSYNDHRIAMAACIASTICIKDVFLDNENAINKSYPNFFRDFKNLGGDICLL